MQWERNCSVTILASRYRVACEARAGSFTR